MLNTPSGQTTEDIADLAATVGIPKERAWDLVIADNDTEITDTAGLVSALNAIGYYDEKAQHLEDAGMTFDGI